MATETEREHIQSHLLRYAEEIGEQNDIDCRILAARDYGSRSRNLQGPNSDYDVMFVFARGPTANALDIGSETYGKSIPSEETELNHEVELHGWSLNKFVGNDGLAGSNPTAIEFALSNETYVDHTEHEWGPDLEDVMRRAVGFFKPYALINHYRSMAASNYGKYVEGDYKMASGTAYKDLLEHVDPGWQTISESLVEECGVSEQHTTIDSDRIGVFVENNNAYGAGSIDIEDAIDEGLVEPTTTDPTIKRYLNVLQALTRSRYVEETHEAPSPMDFTEFLREVAGSDWLPEHVYAEIGDLVALKKSGDGESEWSYTGSLDKWIESELQRDVDPRDHVDRQPDTEYIVELSKEVYNKQRFD